MKVKCTKCGRIVQRTKETVLKAAAKAGYASLESYLKDYVCGECRGENIPPKRTQLEKIEKVNKDKKVDRPLDKDIVQDIDDNEEEEIDQSFEIEDETEEEDTSEIDELEEELDKLIAEEDEEEEVEL
jgi:DNA-directed RNA polymerase subunit RPC12/RpoP